LSVRGSSNEEREKKWLKTFLAVRQTKAGQVFSEEARVHEAESKEQFSSGKDKNLGQKRRSASRRTGSGTGSRAGRGAGC
jgi:hypothetical protein